MGLKFIRTYNDDCRLGLWEIKEDYTVLHNQVALTGDEEAQLNSFGSNSRKIEYLSVRALLQQMTGKESRIIYGKRNKPFISDNSYHISISHSGKLTGIYLSPTRQVGVDLEQMTHRISRIANRFMNPAEKVTTNPDLMRYHLYIHWCAKEALYKLLDKEGLNFREHIIIEPFDPLSEGTLTGHVHNPSIREAFELRYFRMNDYVVVWSCKDLNRYDLQGTRKKAGTA